MLASPELVTQIDPSADATPAGWIPASVVVNRFPAASRWASVESPNTAHADLSSSVMLPLGEPNAASATFVVRVSVPN